MLLEDWSPMNNETINTARYYAASDIAHRWFAFFEGKTEKIDDHLAIFADDIVLSHAGTHRLAEGKESIKNWLTSLPYEVGSHAILTKKFIPLENNLAQLNMDISYQYMSPYGEIGGALSKYQTKIRFDEQNNGTFVFIQKTPILPNPNKVFRDTFIENRIMSFVYYFQRMLIADLENIRTLLPSSLNQNIANMLYLFDTIKAENVHFLDKNEQELSCRFNIKTDNQHYQFKLKLEDILGRYLKIESVPYLKIL